MLRMVVPASGSRPGVYVFPALLNIAEGRNVFEVHPLTTR